MSEPSETSGEKTDPYQHTPAALTAAVLLLILWLEGNATSEPEFQNQQNDQSGDNGNAITDSSHSELP